MHSRKFDNLEEMDKFLLNYKISTLGQEDIKHMELPIKNLKLAIRIFPLPPPLPYKKDLTGDFTSVL